MAFLLLNSKVRGAAEFAGGLILGYILVGFIVIFSSFPIDHPYVAWGLVPLVLAGVMVYVDPIKRLAGTTIGMASDTVVPGIGATSAYIVDAVVK